MIKRTKKNHSAVMVSMLAAIALAGVGIGTVTINTSASGAAKVAQFQKGFYQFAPPTLVTRTLVNGTVISLTRDTYFTGLTNAAVTDVQWGTPIADPLVTTNYPITFSANNANVLAYTNGYWQYNATGSVTLTATTINQTNSVTVTTAAPASATGLVYYGPATNSLCYAATTNINTMLGSLPETTATQQRLSTVNAVWPETAAAMATNTFVANSSAWAASAPLNCVSVWNNRGDSYGSKFQITAISPRHCLAPAHTPPGVGTAFAFLGTDGQTYVRTILSQANAADDVEVVLLNADLPSQVPVAQLLPSTWQNYISIQTVYPYHLPLVYATQQNTLAVADAQQFTTGTAPQITCGPATNTQQQKFNYIDNGHGGLWSGDSGFSAGLIFNGIYSPLLTWHYGGYGSGPCIPGYLSQINSTMTAESTAAGLGSNYQVTTVNLSSFGTF